MALVTTTTTPATTTTTTSSSSNNNNNDDDNNDNHNNNNNNNNNNITTISNLNFLISQKSSPIFWRGPTSKTQASQWHNEGGLSWTLTSVARTKSPWNTWENPTTSTLIEFLMVAPHRRWMKGSSAKLLQFMGRKKSYPNSDLSSGFWSGFVEALEGLGCFSERVGLQVPGIDRRLVEPL